MPTPAISSRNAKLGLTRVEQANTLRNDHLETPRRDAASPKTEPEISEDVLAHDLAGVHWMKHGHEFPPALWSRLITALYPAPKHSLPRPTSSQAASSASDPTHPRKLALPSTRPLISEHTYCTTELLRTASL